MKIWVVQKMVKVLEGVEGYIRLETFINDCKRF